MGVYIFQQTRTQPKMSSLNAQTNDLGAGLTSLTFSEFTWRGGGDDDDDDDDDDKGGHKMISSSNLTRLLNYMQTHYRGVTAIDEMPPLSSDLVRRTYYRRGVEMTVFNRGFTRRLAYLGARSTSSRDSWRTPRESRSAAPTR